MRRRHSQSRTRMAIPTNRTTQMEPDPPLGADERTALDSWLEYHRATLLLPHIRSRSAYILIRPI